LYFKKSQKAILQKIGRKKSEKVREKSEKAILQKIVLGVVISGASPTTFELHLQRQSYK
jgi:homoserine kinase